MTNATDQVTSHRSEKDLQQSSPGDERRAGSPLEVFRVFLKLGVSSFGGPIAHIGYFREEFVVRRRWLSEQPLSIWWRSASSSRGWRQAKADFLSD